MNDLRARAVLSSAWIICIRFTVSSSIAHRTFGSVAIERRETGNSVVAPSARDTAELCLGSLAPSLVLYLYLYDLYTT